MGERPPTSVLLPTIRPTDAVGEIARQLRAEDELLVVCDDEDDPVASEDRPASDGEVRVVIAGDPERCSGKANAIAVAMAEARNDWFVWTDDDFTHAATWLDDLHESYERVGPVTELPFFVGRDPLSVLFEPMYAFSAPLGIYLSGDAWGGAVAFGREDLDVDALLADLRRSISDDGVLSEHVDVSPVRRVRRVSVGGTIRETVERHVRFIKIVHRHGPVGAVSMGAATAVVTALCLLFPLFASVLSTLAVVSVYARFGLRRWTFVLAFPSLLIQLPLLMYALARRTFVWGGRRYRWTDAYEVSIVEG